MSLKAAFSQGRKEGKHKACISGHSDRMKSTVNYFKNPHPQVEWQQICMQ